MASFSTSHAWRAERALSVVRVMIALLLFIHGMARLTQGGVVPFGGWLESQGFPFGLGIAWFVTGYELLAAPLLALGMRRLVTPVCAVFVVIYSFGLWLVHWPAGWFVVGLGRNGMEYSVLLIVSLLAVGWCYWPDMAPRKRR